VIVRCQRVKRFSFRNLAAAFRAHVSYYRENRLGAFTLTASSCKENCNRSVECDGTMGWHYVMALCDGTMGWHYGMELCDGTMGWHYGMALCDGTM
jgi:hypothetical protein